MTEAAPTIGTPTTLKILVAGIGNIFLGDDAFGSEVARRMLNSPLSSHMNSPSASAVRIVDFGIRAIDLTYAFLDDNDLVILVDATSRGQVPGTVYTIQPDINDLGLQQISAGLDELSIALRILDIASEESRKHDDAIVTAVHLQLGALSGVLERALVSAYELARESSPFPESVLVIEHVAIQVYCDVCQAERFVVSIQQMSCETCGTPTANVICGREMEIVAMEMEDRVAH